MGERGPPVSGGPAPFDTPLHVPELPAGTVTFLFSDIERSTELLQRLGDLWGDVLGVHRRLLREAFGASGGREVDNQGDAFFFVFGRARDAVGAAGGGQRALTEHEWPEDVDLRVRMGLHTGEPAVGDEGYLGIDVVRAARICSAAHGGQVLVSETTRALVRDVEFLDLGQHRLKDLEGEHHLYQLVMPGLLGEFPPPQTLDLVPYAPPLPLDLTGRESEYATRAQDLAARIEAEVTEDVNRVLATAGIPGYDAKAALPDPPRRQASLLRRLFGRGGG